MKIPCHPPHLPLLVAFLSSWLLFSPVFSQSKRVASQALALKKVEPIATIETIHFYPKGARSLKEFPLAATTTKLPPVFTPPKPRSRFTRHPWKNAILTTVFWVGEKPTANNPVPNTASSWDPKWTNNFGGYDDPDPENRNGWLPRSFTPKQNPFYFALPYNDTMPFGKQRRIRTKATARECVPWFDQAFYREGKSVLKGRWIAVRRGSKVCYGQWEDCGPFETDNWQYVFGDQRPRTKGNGGAGLDVSPAMRDYLGFRWNAICDWRFVELHEVPDGPWRNWGNNNPFAPRPRNSESNVSESIIKLRDIERQFINRPATVSREEVARDSAVN